MPSLEWADEPLARPQALLNQAASLHTLCIRAPEAGQNDRGTPCTEPGERPTPSNPQGEADSKGAVACDGAFAVRLEPAVANRHGDRLYPVTDLQLLQQRLGAAPNRPLAHKDAGGDLAV